MSGGGEFSGVECEAVPALDKKPFAMLLGWWGQVWPEGASPACGWGRSSCGRLVSCIGLLPSPRGRRLHYFGHSSLQDSLHRAQHDGHVRARPPSCSENGDRQRDSGALSPHVPRSSSQASTRGAEKTPRLARDRGRAGAKMCAPCGNVAPGNHRGGQPLGRVVTVQLSVLRESVR